MTTTTGDPTTLKTPSTLSGGDLVSRLLAATPPYLYNVPLTPHSFFFSEMLRSFVQAKTETSYAGAVPPAPRRRKRSWRDARDRPLELTTKERSHEKYFHPDNHLENRTYPDTKSHAHFEQKPDLLDVLKPVDENKSDFCKHKGYFDDRQSFASDQVASHEAQFASEQKVKPEDLPGDAKTHCTFEDQAKTTHSKLDFSSRNFLPGLPGRAEEAKTFSLPANVPNPDFLPSPMWYPPYPMPQSYAGIDPLHFFIDLRVSGHIWDRKLTERQLPFKSKHCSAFSVPQSKEYNRPLNLTRDEASSSKSKDENAKGTHYILKNLTRTYKDILDAEKSSRTTTSDEGSEINAEANGSQRKGDSSLQSQSTEEEKKDIRALIGLELVVDYVKEPNDESSKDHPAHITESLSMR